MEKMKNEGTVERILQTIISLTFLYLALFVVGGKWQVLLFLFSLMVTTFATISFCPLYKVLGINRYKEKK